MAFDPFRTRKALVAVKLGSGSQTPAATDQFLALKPSFKPTVDQNVDESIRASYVKQPTIAGGTYAELGFSVYPKGAGSDNDPEFGDALKACGMARKTGEVSTTLRTFVFDTSVTTPATVLWQVDPGASRGYIFKIQDSFGTFKLSSEAGKLLLADFNFKGSYVAVTEGVAPTGSFTADTTKPQAFKSATVTIMDVVPSASNVMLSGFSLDAGNQLTIVEDAVNANAYAGVLIGDRKITGSFQITAPDLGTLDLFAKMLNATAGLVSFNWGTASTDKVTVKVPTTYIKNLDVSDKDGRLFLSADFDASGAAEQSDFELAFGT